jgi:hypothetical protein
LLLGCGAEAVEDVGEGVDSADVAWEDDEGAAEDVGWCLDGSEEGDLAGQELSGDGGSPDPQATDGQIV